MRKSSLGRRSSVSQIPVRLSSAGGSSEQKSCSGARKRSGSLIRQPGFSQTKRRSQSEDRESISSGRKTMARSNTSGAIHSLGLGAMTPRTPGQTFNANLPTGSTRPKRGDAMSTESNRRMSSFGGGKNSRKDPRPISEKAFQQAAQAKVQQYFDSYGTDVIGAGQSIRPMTTNLFINMVDHLLKYYDSRYVITKSNYLEELPVILRKLGYKCKLDRSWMMTVNTPHSWQHVIALLSWLVDGIECMECDDPWGLMYSNIELNSDLNEEDEMAIDGKVIAFLKSSYKLRNDPNRDSEVEQLEVEFVQRMIIEANCTEEDFEVVEKQIDLIDQDIQKFEEKYQAQSQLKEELANIHDTLLKDQEATEQFIFESEAFVAASHAKLETLNAEIASQGMILERKQEELQKVHDKVKGQSITVEEKEKLTAERHELLRRIQFYENSIRGYEKSAFTVDLKLAEGLRKLDNLLVEYGTSVAENTVLDPRIRDVNLDMSAFQLNEAVLKTVSENLATLKDDGKKSLSDLRVKREESENFLSRINHDIKETEEKIGKEKTLLEGVESDLKQHQDQVAKNTQKLKEEAMRYEKLTRAISEEISQFDPSKLEEKRIELKKMEHDLKLLKERQEKYFRGALANFKEAQERVKNPMQRWQELRERLKNKLQLKEEKK